MSVARTETVDAVSIRAGWAVLSIHEFEAWSEIEDPAQALREKLETYFDHLTSPRFLEKHHRMPARIELVSRDPLPDAVAALCVELGVVAEAGE